MAVIIEKGLGRTPKSALTDHTRYQEPLALKLLDGEWPADLTGHVFLTSPDIATGVPLFGSDGMIYRLDSSIDAVQSTTVPPARYKHEPSASR